MPLQDWDKLPGESSIAFGWFALFRDLPPERRSILEAYRVKRPAAMRANGTLNRFSHKFKWGERASAYDAYRDRLRRAAVEEAERRDIEANATNRRQFRANELQLADLGFRKVREILEVATFSPVSPETPNAVPEIRLPANMMFAAATLFRVSSVIGRQALGIKEDDGGDDVSPESFKEIFFRTRGQLERVLPNGAMPTMPDNVTAKPQVYLPSNGNGNGHALKKPDRLRP